MKYIITRQEESVIELTSQFAIVCEEVHNFVFLNVSLCVGFNVPLLLFVSRLIPLRLYLASCDKNDSLGHLVLHSSHV